MVEVQRIDSLDLPEVAPYKAMRGQLQQREEGIFVAESDKVVRRLLESDFVIVSLLLPEKWYHRFKPLLDKRAEDIVVYLLEKPELEKLTGFTFFQGVLGVGKVPPPPSMESLLGNSPRPRLLIGLQGISNAENLGCIVRNGAALGVHGLLVDRTSSSPYLRRAVRGSMGTIFRVPAIEKLNLVQTVPHLQKQGIRCIAAHPHADGRTLYETDFTSDCCIIFGSEGHGISPELLAVCDEAAAIPMTPGVDSLNVGSAAAVFLYEADRQRRTTQSRNRQGAG